VLAAFVRPGVVVVHGQPDTKHHDHDVMAENIRRLTQARDAKGRALEIIPLNAPEDAVMDGVSIDHSYVNFSYVNDGIVMSAFGDPVADANAQGTLKDLFPERQIAQVNAEPIFRNGGGVHCITQHEPDIATLRLGHVVGSDSSG
ncbi:MAG TPA: agmatine deiminase family protein, partial [Burkholderiaceae bacterium]|nr:agmatine deiminase family protein [Burkholderiaceae bacterium]